MAATENTSKEGTSLFCSSFDYKVDEKRRVQVPSDWRQGQMAGLRYLLLPMPKRAWRPACLLVMPPEFFLKKIDVVRQMKISDDHADSLRRMVATRASQVETDGAGRICLPERMARAIDVTDRAVLAGMVDWFEIWSPERFAQAEMGDEERTDAAIALF